MAKVRSAASAFAVSLVILGLAFVGATALAILFYAQSEKAQRDADIAKAQLSAVKGPGDDARPAVTSLSADGDKPGTLVSRLADANEKLLAEKKLAEVNLKASKDAVGEAAAELAKREAELARLRNEMASVVATSKAKVDVSEAEAESKSKEAVQRSQEAALKIAAADEEVKAATKSLNDAIAAHQAALAQKDEQAAAKDRQLAQAKEDLKRAYDKIRNAHQPMASDVATVDSVVTEVLDNGDACIKLGSAERVRLGMTFEVFPADSVIHLQAGNTVIGKATLEVYRVSQHDCVARVVRRSAGNARLLVGDGVVNLAYNPYAEVNFVVYGAFDINNTKNPNVVTEDENRVKSLITSSGGKVIEIDPNDPQVILSPDVDYLVLGKEPVSPVEPTGDEATNVASISAFKRAQKNYNLYMSLMGQARQMQIPVLNQNRFLELVGFYHRSKVKPEAAIRSN